jgi:hypothetical protein
VSRLRPLKTNVSAELFCVHGGRPHEISYGASSQLPVSDIGNSAMKHGFVVTLAAPALAFAATSGMRRVLWAASGLRRELNIRA